MRLLSKGASVLDERETQEMYRAEHTGFWLMYGLLFASVIVQLFFGAQPVQLAGEAAVIALVSVVMLFAYARRGIWDAHARPSAKGNAVYAAVSGAAVAVIVTALRGSVLWGAAAGLVMSALCFLALSLMMLYVRRRQSEQEDAFDEETDA